MFVITGATGILMEAEITVGVTMNVVLHRGIRSTIVATLGAARETKIAMAVVLRDTRKRVVLMD